MLEFYNRLAKEEERTRQLIAQLHTIYVYPVFIIDKACKELVSHYPYTTYSTLSLLLLGHDGLRVEFQAILDRLASREYQQEYQKLYEKVVNNGIPANEQTNQS